MKILVNDFAGSAFQIQLSRALAHDGHTVLHTFFAAIGTPKGSTTARADDVPGFTIEPLAVGRDFNRYSVWSRRFSDLAYGKAVSERVRSFKPDVVLSANMPLDGQKILLRATHGIGAKFIVWLQDLLSVGNEFVLRKKKIPFARWAGTFYSRLERTILSQSDGVVCIAPEFKVKLKGWGIESTKIFLIENWAPLDEIVPAPRDNAWAQEQGISEKFCFMYSGTLGMKHKPELLLQLAMHFDGRQDVVIATIAQGAGADWLYSQTQGRLKSLLILPFQPYGRLSEVLGTADVLITILDADCGTFAVPSKTLAYMCAGRPLLVAAPECNLAAQTVKRAGAGEVVASETSQPFLDAAGRLLEDATLRRRYATNARSYAEQTFGIERIRDQFLDVFDVVSSGSRVRR